MDKIVEKLQNFNFTKVEAQVYLCLLKNGELNGSQISKHLNIPRTTVYSVLDSLYSKGNIFMLPGEPTIYRVQDPKVLLERLKKNYTDSIELLENSLSGFNTFGTEDQYWNIKGYNNFLINTKKILLEAKDEVYISSTFNLQLFKEEIQNIINKKVRVIVFSFDELDTTNLCVEFYHHAGMQDCYNGKRWMMVVDNKKGLIANENTYGEVLGTFTENQLMISVIAEHIHHDIYLLKLKQKYNKNIITRDIVIDSAFERNSVMSRKVLDEENE